MITVLLAAYNGEAYIREQLDSILNQSCQQFRLIGADDGSKDETARILLEYAVKYPEKIWVMEFESPSGSPQGNFFRLLGQISDDYVMLSDQDDIWLPEKIAATLGRMKEMERRFGAETPILVHGDLTVVDAKKHVIHQSMRHFQKIAPSHQELCHYLVENNITGNTVMINKALLALLQQIPETCCMHDWWMGLTASCFGQISYLDHPLVLYRQHEDNQLGANGISDIESVKKRIHAGDRVRENYRRMFAQARCFLNMHQHMLSNEQKLLLEEFIKIPQLGRMGRMRTILRCKLFKSTLLRTLGQMWFIG